MTRGGKRPGAGRTELSGPYREKTKVMRVPESAIPEVREYLERRPKTLALAPLSALQADEVDISRADLSPEPLRLPLMGGAVAAGFPQPSDEFIEDWLDLNSLYVPDKETTFFIKVKGDSMRDAGIRPGDMLIVDRSRSAEHGDIVIAVLDGELTVKELAIQDAQVRLLPANPEYPVIEIRPHQQLYVWGIVMHSIHRHYRRR